MRKAVIIISVVGLLAWLAYQATGSRFSGDATTPNDIPIIGADLSELVFVGPAGFRGLEHPHGGGTFAITGTATRESMLAFCSVAEVSMSKNGTDIADRNDILEYLGDRKIALPKSTSDESLDVLFGYGGRFPKLYGVYNATTERFGIALQFHGTK